MDPVELGGVLGMGKIMATNALNRFGHHIAPVRWLGREVAGIGARTAMQGKPMLSGPLRHAMAVGVDPKLTSLYENAHAIGRNAHNAEDVRGSISALRALPEAQNIPAVAQATDFASKIPLESTGVRKVIDYGFTPVSQVGQDIKQGLTNAYHRVRPVARAQAAAPALRTGLPVTQ